MTDKNAEFTDYTKYFSYLKTNKSNKECIIKKFEYIYSIYRFNRSMCRLNHNIILYMYVTIIRYCKFNLILEFNTHHKNITNDIILLALSIILSILYDIF